VDGKHKGLRQERNEPRGVEKYSVGKNISDGIRERGG
jgi:hypothetical protein